MSIHEDQQYLLAVQAHDAAYAAGYWPNQADLYSPSLIINGMPTLSLSPSISTRRWTEEQLGRVMAPIGTVFEVKTCQAGSFAGDEWVSYALLRVDTPERWICFALHYKNGENCMQLIQHYLAENNIQVALNPQAVLAPEMPIAWLSLNGDGTWTTRQ